jgi:uncharacterized repeat protein (TIGR03803 family)
VVFDRAGNLYGTTAQGGPYGQGDVYELSPAGNGWSETVLWNFTGGLDGGWPEGSLLVDSAGNLYGTTSTRGLNSKGAVFKLSPSGSGWNLSPIYSFEGQGLGSVPYSGLATDAHGNLYGSTVQGGQYNAGIAFELSPLGDGWTYSLISTFVAAGPVAPPVFDAAGNLYFACEECGHDGYDVKLTDNNGVWSSTLLHGFGGGGDGATSPVGSLVLDAGGNIYGMTYAGGAYGAGVIYEITP